MRIHAIAVAVAAVLSAAPTAHADSPRPWVAPGLSRSYVSPHAVVHYGTATTPAVAAGVADAAERALAAYAQLGFPSPREDGDGHLDIYVQPLSVGSDSKKRGYAHPDAARPGPAAIELRPDAVANPYYVSHEVFHTVQYAIGGGMAGWLREATADWAAFQVVPAGRFDYFDTPGVPLDCMTNCGDDPYRRWVFFEAISERLGARVVRAALFEAAGRYAWDGRRHGLDAIQAVLARRGTAVGAALARLGGLMAGGTFRLMGLTGRVAKPASHAGIGAVGARVADQRLTIAHDALAFAAFRGTAAACVAGTLRITVDAPAGIGGFYALFARPGQAAVRLAVSGRHASGAFAWSTCASARGMLAVANAASDDGLTFTVHAKLAP